MKRLPHQTWIEYLVTLGLSDAEIRLVLRKDGLVVPDPAELVRLGSDLDLPADLRFADPQQPSSVRWLEQRNLTAIVRGEMRGRDAVRILRSAAIRHPVEVLLLGGHAPENVHSFISERALGRMSLPGVEYFRVAFWDVPGLSTAGWVEFLRRHPAGAAYMEILSGGPDVAMRVADAFVNRLKGEVRGTTLPDGNTGAMLNAPRLFPNGVRQGGSF